MRTIAEINDKILTGQAIAWTVAELKAKIQDIGVKQAFQTVDVICTGTFEPMESSGAIINLGHTDPPIKISQCWFDGVPAYAGFGAVDLYLGATALTDYTTNEIKDIDPNSRINFKRGGGHVIEDLIAGKSITFKALGQPTDCYPKESFENTINKNTINQFYLFNPRNLYQNFIVGVNGSDRPLYTYLGTLQPRLGNAVYSNPGAISPLLNDPDLKLIGIGTKIWLGGGVGYVAWEGTQHFPRQKRLPNRTPIGPAATVALIGDAKQMKAHWVRGCYFQNYGASLMLGVGVPLPVLQEEVIVHCAVQDRDIVAPVIDFSIPRRVRPTFGLVTYQQLKSGRIAIEGNPVRVAPLASIAFSRQIAEELKQQIMQGEFTLTEPVASLPQERTFIPQDPRGSTISLEE
ncbi:MAG TPA: homocysteine biosynthesis protein [Xenococcaceae cyanobacterium]